MSAGSLLKIREGYMYNLKGTSVTCKNKPYFWFLKVGEPCPLCPSLVVTENDEKLNRKVDFDNGELEVTENCAK